jgi:hypothetical protein
MIYGKRAAEIVSALVSEKAVNAELRSQLARVQAHFDWLAQHVNELKLERAELYRRIGVFVPVPEIQTTAAAAVALPGMDDNYVPPATSRVPDLGNVLARARESITNDHKTRETRAAHGRPFDGDIFNDVGDEEAERLGLLRDELGVLVEDRPATR